MVLPGVVDAVTGRGAGVLAGWLATGLLAAWVTPDPVPWRADMDDEALLEAWGRSVGLDRAFPRRDHHLARMARFVDGDPDLSVAAGVARAQALGLDRVDPVARTMLSDRARRVLGQGAVPDEALQAEARAHVQARWRLPARVVLEHRVFDPARRRDAEGDARAARTILASGGTASGDAFDGLVGRQTVDPAGVARAWGDPVAQAVREAVASEDRGWIGPVQGPFGWHLIRVVAVEDGVAPDASAIARQAGAWAQTAARARQRAERLASLRAEAEAAW